MSQATHNVWQRNGSRFNRELACEHAWFTPAERCLYERRRQGKMIFGGFHREYFLEEGRTQFNFTLLNANGQILKPYAMWNVLGLISQKTADLLFGEKPNIKIDDATLQTQIDAIVDRSGLHGALHEGAVEASWATESYYEVSRLGSTPGEQAGAAYVTLVPAMEMYPVGARRSDGQYGEYVRYSTAETTIFVAGVSTSTKLLLEVRYTRGRITRKCFELKSGPGGSARGEAMSIDAWPVKLADGSSLPEEELTGLSRVSIICVPNQIVCGVAASDYDNLLEQQDTLNAKNTQVTVVLAKHAMPKFRAPKSAADNEGNLNTSGEVFWSPDGAAGDGGYGYITWDAKLEPAMADKKATLHALCTQAEFPASVLGLEESGADDSARKVRLKAAPALAKVARKVPIWQKAIRLMISLAMEAENGAVPTMPIAVEMRDGLPVDPMEVAEEVSTLVSARVMSKRRALMKQGLDKPAQDDELAELAKEAEQDVPSVLLGKPGEQIEPVATVAA